MIFIHDHSEVVGLLFSVYLECWSIQMRKRHNFNIFLLTTLKALDEALLMKIVLGTSRPSTPPARPPHPVLLPPPVEPEKAVIINIIIIIIIVVVVIVIVIIIVIIIIITPIQPDNPPQQHCPDPPAA